MNRSGVPPMPPTRIVTSCPEGLAGGATAAEPGAARLLAGVGAVAGAWPQAARSRTRADNTNERKAAIILPQNRGGRSGCSGVLFDWMDNHHCVVKELRNSVR